PRWAAWLLALSLVVAGMLGGCRRGPEGSMGVIPSARVVARAAEPSVPEGSDRPPPSVAAPPGMVWIPGGTFWMGADEGTMKDAGPVHEVMVDGFWMDRTEVTNRQFAEFVKATGYVTVAERPPDPKDFPDAPPEKLVPGSLVFTPPVGEVSLQNPLVWWS